MDFDCNEPIKQELTKPRRRPVAKKENANQPFFIGLSSGPSVMGDRCLNIQRGSIQHLPSIV
jgi:hypothetical protein